MTNKETERKIRQAFSNAVPNIRDSVLSDCKTQKGAITIMTDTKKKHVWRERLIGMAAALVLFIGGTAGFQLYKTNFAIDSTISLDVNPSIEIQVNKKEEVLAVNAMNEDAQIVVGDMDFKGSSLDLTINALIGSMLRNGYLNELANSILVSVDSGDTVKGAQLQERLANEISTVLETGTFNGAVLSQTISADADLRALAENYGITLGKAQLIQQIVTQNTLYSFSDLVPLSINDLNLLSESGNLNLENIASSGTASDKAYIGKDKALEIAIAHAGVAADTVRHSEADLDYEDGALVYEVEFKSEGFEYDYDIDAVTGEIRKNKKETDDSYIPPQPVETPEPAVPESTQETKPDTKPESKPQGSSKPAQNTAEESKPAYIGEAKAKETALSHAGVSADSLSKYECKLDRENGIMVYEIEFDSSGYEFEYEINASTGAVVKHKKDRDDDYHHEEPGHSGSGGSASYIGDARARDIAFSHAGVSSDSVSNYECHLDDDDGIMNYEIEFECGNCDYEYEIEAVSGAVIKYERDDD